MRKVSSVPFGAASAGVYLRRWLLSLATVTILLSASMAAEVYQYHPKSPLRIGGGFDPLRPDRAFPDCLESADPVKLSAGPPETVFDSSLVKTRKELYHHLQIDASLSASYGLFSASASFSLDEEYSFSESDVLWVVKATTDYGRYALRSPRLTADAQRLARDPVAFAQHCGREYVSQERRLVHAVAIYHFHNLSESERRHVQASLSASYGAGAFSVGGSMNLNEITSALKSIYQVNVSVYAIGGEGITKLKDLTEKDDLSEVRSILKSYVEGLTIDRATPVEFLTSSWQSLGVNLLPPVMHFRRIALSEYYFMFRHTQTRLEEFGERMRVLTSSPQTQATAQQVSVFLQQYASLAGRLKLIQDRALMCLRDPEELCKLNLTFEPLPQVPTAEFEMTWVRTDAFGHRYSLDIDYENSHLPGPFDFRLHLVTGLLANAPTVRFVSYEIIQFPSQTENKGDTLQNDNRLLRLVRHPNGDAQVERVRVYYEVLQRTCVRYCFGQ